VVASGKSCALLEAPARLHALKDTSVKTTKSSAADRRNSRSALELKLGPIIYRTVADLKPYAGNPRLHSERQIVQLAASIREFGFVLPVLITVESEIIAGHARVLAAARAGLAEVPVIVADHLSKAQIKAYRLADNQLSLQSTWSNELLRIELADLIEIAEVPIEVLGWNTGEIDAILSIDDGSDEPDDDIVPEPPARPVAIRGDLWLLGKHRLLCGSSLDPDSWERLMDGAIGSMVFTDAPYNLPQKHISGTNRHESFSMAAGEMSFDQFVAFNASYLENMKKHLKDGAVVMACMDHAHILELMTAARQTGLHHLNLCVWKKSNAGLGSLYRSHYELILVLKQGRSQHVNNILLGKNGRYRTNVIECAGANSFGPSRMQDLKDHPTVKPRQLVADFIRDVTKHGDVVLDAFSGSGATISACEMTGRIGYAIEIEPKYIDVAIRRFEQQYGQKAVLEATGQTFDEIKALRHVDLPPIDA
jgi:DNA modification methylase